MELRRISWHEPVGHRWEKLPEYAGPKQDSGAQLAYDSGKVYARGQLPQSHCPHEQQADLDKNQEQLMRGQRGDRGGAQHGVPSPYIALGEIEVGPAATPCVCEHSRSVAA